MARHRTYPIVFKRQMAQVFLSGVMREPQLQDDRRGATQSAARKWWPMAGHCPGLTGDSLCWDSR